MRLFASSLLVAFVAGYHAAIVNVVMQFRQNGASGIELLIMSMIWNWNDTKNQHA